MSKKMDTKLITIANRQELEYYYLDFYNLLEQRLDKILPINNQLCNDIAKSMRYTLLSRGKRMRSLLCEAIGSCYEIETDVIVDISCSIEMIHTASIILDDMPCMDDSPTRRNKPANHLAYGEYTSILACVGLISKAVETILRLNQLNIETRNSLSRYFVTKIGINGMCAGQHADLKYKSTIDSNDVRFIIDSRKTSILFVCACVMSAIISKPKLTELIFLKHIGVHFGLAFQAINDIEDLPRNSQPNKLSDYALQHINLAKYYANKINTANTHILDLIDRAFII